MLYDHVLVTFVGLSLRAFGPSNFCTFSIFRQYICVFVELSLCSFALKEDSN